MTEVLEPAPDILFIENVGTLVCPSSYELGEHLRVVVTSTPEGEDTPPIVATTGKSPSVAASGTRTVN